MELPNRTARKNMTELNPEASPEAVKDDVIAPTPGNMIRRPEAFAPPVVEEAEVVEVVAEEPAPQPEPEVEKPKKPAPKPAASKASELPSVELLAAAFVESPTRKNSQTVAWAQDRLAELGYESARADLSGWYSSGTAAAVAAFQKDKGIKSHEVRETLEALVAGTKASVV